MPKPANYGQAVILTAGVTAGATGKVTFYDGPTVLGVGTISGTQAVLSTVMLASGNRLLRAYYGGDATYAASSSTPVSQTIVAGTSLGLYHAIDYWTSPQAAIAVGDFNGDGKQDFVATSSFANYITVFLGNGNGTFQAGVNYNIASYSPCVAVGDFNGDGRMDLVVANQFTSNVSVLLGNGDGTFQAAVNYPAGSSPLSLAVADFNGDGKADLVVGGNAGNNLSVLLGNGDGTFGAAVGYSAGAPILSVTTGDFNGDGKTDIAAGTSSGISVLLGSGNGTFAPAVAYTTSASNYSLAVGDFNGDGKADLAAATQSGLYVLRGKGDGTFLASVSYSSDPLQSVVVGDLNGDGNADLAVTGWSSNSVGLLLGNGDGAFQAAVYYPVTSNNYAVAVGDFNGDGKADLLVTGGANFSELLGGAMTDLAIAATPGGAFTQAQIGAVYTVTVIDAGDLASSGPVTVAIVLPAGFTATSVGGSGWSCVAATLTCTRTDSLSAGAGYPIAVTMNIASSMTGNATSTFTVSGGGDQNAANNSATDTAFVRVSTVTTLLSSPNPAVLGHAVTLTATVTTGATGNVTFYDGVTILGTGTLAGGQAAFTTSLLPSGTRSLQARYLGDASHGPSISPTDTQAIAAAAVNGLLPSSSYKVDGSPSWVVTGDFNGDGKPDLVTVNNNSSNGSIGVLLGNGDGTFRPAVTYAAVNGSNSAVVADFNGDGKADIAIAGNSGIYVLLGNGDGTFRAAVSVSPFGSYSSLGYADFNWDGKPDLVALDNGAVVLFPGNGDGTFQPPATITGGSSFNLLAVADMNRDGRADLVACGPGAASVLLGNGDGTFQSQINGPANSYAEALAVGDFDGDGIPDVAFATGGGVAVQLGKGDGSLRASIPSNTMYAQGSFAIAGDFNGDGRLDIAFVSYPNQVNLAFGNGDGSFQPAVSFLTDASPTSIVQGDFNGDGRPDFAVSNFSGTVNVFLGAQVSGLSISLTHAGNFMAGQAGAYQIIVENPAFTASGTATVTDTLPTGLTATAINGAGWACTLSTLTCTTANGLSSGQSYPAITISVNVAGSLSPSTIANQASVSIGGFVNTATDPTKVVMGTVTTLSVSPNPSSIGQTVTLTATVSAGATGTVLFSDGGTPLGTAVLTSGQATFGARLWPSGRHSLVAGYVGDSTHVASASTAQAQTVTALPANGFTTAATFTTGEGPWAIASADFDRDGTMDLIAVNSVDGTVSVLLGNGDGTFRPKSDYPVGTNPVAVVTGDFNNDGKMDIAVANEGDNDVSILLGNGDGTFHPAVTYPTGNEPTSLAVGDLNGDGKVDLVVANLEDSSLTLLFGNGDGTFHAAAATLNAPNVTAVAIGDFNHDGKADIACTGYGMYVILGNGDGTFQSSLFNNVEYLNDLAVGDLNADGSADIVTGDGTGVNVLLGNGNGAFQPPVHYVTGSLAAAVVFADVNGDGKLDVVSVNAGSGTITVLLGNGDGTLQPAIPYTVGTNPRGIVAGDFNGDGRTDLAVANFGSGNVSVLLGALTPVVSVSSSHSGSFTLGQTGAVYIIGIVNNGPGVTTGTVTVTDTLPTGLSATAITGTGWSCTLTTLTCTRADSVSAGKSYPAITLTVTVAQNAPVSATNQVNVSGGGALTASASDLTSISAPTVLTTIQTNPAGLQFSMDGGTAQTAPQALTLPLGAHTVAVITTQAGTAGTQYVFTGWSDSGTASHSITVGAASAVYTATFKTQYQLTLLAAPPAQGTVTPASGVFYDSATAVPIGATPNTSYSFSFWSGDLTGMTNSQTVTMNAPHSVTANFSNSCLSLAPIGASLPATGTSTPTICPDPNQSTCGFYPEVPVTLAVTPSGDCGEWTATSSNPAFIQVASGAGGNGKGAVSLTVLANTHTVQRNATITVSSGAASASYLLTEAGSTDNQNYREVYALYQQLLGRDPDQSGFTFWTGPLGVGLGQMADLFLTSPEAVGSDFAVVEAYQAALGLPPTYAQYTGALAGIRAGAQTVGGLFASLIDANYTAANLYQNLLNRQPVAGEITSANAAGLPSWFQTLIANNEFQSTGSFSTDHTNGLYLRMLYYVILGRDPDPSGLNFWVGIANGGGPGIFFQGTAGSRSRLSILGLGTPNEGFIGSPEFQGLFAN